MVCKKETEIKEKLKTYGFSLKALANSIDVKYSTLLGYLNGFNPMPDELRNKINELISERENING